MSFKGFYLSLKLVETLYGKLCARSLASSIHQYTRTYTVYSVHCRVPRYMLRTWFVYLKFK